MRKKEDTMEKYFEEAHRFCSHNRIYLKKTLCVVVFII